MLQLIAIGVTILTAFVGVASIVNAVRLKEAHDHEGAHHAAPVARSATTA